MIVWYVTKRQSTQQYSIIGFWFHLSILNKDFSIELNFILFVNYDILFFVLFYFISFYFKLIKKYIKNSINVFIYLFIYFFV